MTSTGSGPTGDGSSLVRELLDNGGIAIALQPIVNQHVDRVVGWEALVRGSHPVRGGIPPLTLIAAAAEEGLLDELTQEVVEQSLDAMGEAVSIIGSPLNITVNLEPGQLYPGNPFLEWLKRRTIPADVMLLMEVSERGGYVWTDDHDNAANELTSHGIQLGLDDYGSGFTRLGFLRQRGWDLIKIDQSFLTRDTPRDRWVLKLFVEMMHDLHMPTLAEGIETEQHRELAESIGVDYEQGYLLGRPATVADTLARLRDNGLLVETPRPTG